MTEGKNGNLCNAFNATENKAKENMIVHKSLIVSWFCEGV